MKKDSHRKQLKARVAPAVTAVQFYIFIAANSGTTLPILILIASGAHKLRTHRKSKSPLPRRSRRTSCPTTGPSS